MGRGKDDITEKKLRGTARKDRQQVETAGSGKPITDARRVVETSGYKELSGRAKTIYRNKCRELMRGPGLFATDLHQIVLYAHSYEQYWVYDDQAKKYGPIMKVTNKFGDTVLVPNPAIKMRRDALKDVTTIAARFGFSPVDRAKIKLEVKEEDPLEAFMKEIGGDR